MKILLSPAKKMRQDVDSLAPEGLPALLPKAEQVMAYLKSLSASQLQMLWGCNDAIAQQNMERLEHMDLRKFLTPAILSYEGIAYQYMAPAVFEDAHFAYIQQHLRILSGFYGVLRPMDGVTPYRLEMQAKAHVAGTENLYRFWGRDLYDQIRDPDGVLINLASKEYSKAIEPYLTPDDTYITCVFGEMVKGKLVQKGTFAKMARGEMVRYLAEQQAEDPAAMQEFSRLGYHFRSDLSSDIQYVFERIPE